MVIHDTGVQDQDTAVGEGKERNGATKLERQKKLLRALWSVVKSSSVFIASFFNFHTTLCTKQQHQFAGYNLPVCAQAQVIVLTSNQSGAHVFPVASSSICHQMLFSHCVQLTS